MRVSVEWRKVYIIVENQYRITALEFGFTMKYSHREGFEIQMMLADAHPNYIPI